jgi:hypothetical protein
MAHWYLPVAIGALVLVIPELAFGQTDEIQVYDGSIAAPGIFNLTWHNNYIPKGIDTLSYPGGVVADQSFNGVTEWAYGVTNWFETGLYLPLYSHDKNLGWGINGAKLRSLFASPRADDRRFIYGANLEFSWNAKRWDQSRFTSEVRPIVGWHLKPWDVILNPIVDTAYDGLENLEFVPAWRVAYHLDPDWAVAAEEYANYGRFGDWASPSEQVHQLYGVVDRSIWSCDVEAGVGVGLTDATDHVTVKLLVSRDLNSKPAARP